MRSNKGITLTSLVIYIIVSIMAIGIIGSITEYFTSNLDDVVISSNTAEQYTRLTTYLSDDINSISCDNIEVVGDNCINVIFKDGSYHQYTYSNNNIYYMSFNNDNTKEKNIMLCKEIDNYTFKQENSKLKISITINGITYNNNYSI